MPNTFNLYEEIKEIEREILDTANEFIKEECDKVADVGNPEDLVHKPYSQWLPQDMQTLSGIYVYDRKPLEDFVQRKEIDKLFEMIRQNTEA